MSESGFKTVYKKMLILLALFAILVTASLSTLYMLGYFATSTCPQTEVKSPSPSTVYRNNMQKTMDRLKELLLNDSEAQNAEKKNDFLEKEIKEIAEKFTMAVLQERVVNHNCKSDF